MNNVMAEFENELEEKIREDALKQGEDIGWKQGEDKMVLDFVQRLMSKGKTLEDAMSSLPLTDAEKQRCREILEDSSK